MSVRELLYAIDMGIDYYAPTVGKDAISIAFVHLSDRLSVCSFVA